MSGPHSRDYDTLLGHGMMYLELTAHGLPGAAPMTCEWMDPHVRRKYRLSSVSLASAGDGLATKKKLYRCHTDG